MTINRDRFTAAMTDASASVFRTSGDQRVAISICQLAAGQRATIDAIACRSGSPEHDVEQRLAAWPAVRDDNGAVVGFRGLAAEAVTGHQITFAGADTAWAWCAYDTLFIPDLLGTSARVTSRCPVTGTAVGLTVSPDGVDGLEPAEASISLLAADAPIDDDVRQTLCQYIDFFASLAAAEQWVLGNPVTFWLPVADAFDVARWANAAVFPVLAADTERR